MPKGLYTKFQTPPLRDDSHIHTFKEKKEKKWYVCYFESSMHQIGLKFP